MPLVDTDSTKSDLIMKKQKVTGDVAGPSSTTAADKESINVAGTERKVSFGTKAKHAGEEKWPTLGKT